MDKWADYSAGKLTGTALRAAGFTGVVRYIDDPENWRTKHTNNAEYASLVGAGLAVVLVMEVGTSDADGGYNQGVAYAKRALSGANALGYSGPIFFANDRTTVNVSLWRSYLDGAASVLGIGRVGAYGFKDAVNAAIGHASYFWQAGRQADVQSHVHLYQWNNGNTSVSGITCDINYLYKAISPVVAVASPSTARTTREELQMLLPPGEDMHMPIPASGLPPYFYIACAYGDTVDVHQIDYVGETKQDGSSDFKPGGFNDGSLDAAGFHGKNGKTWTFNSDKPGGRYATKIPDGTIYVSLRYSTKSNSAVAWVG
ncbi:glycoside hydrolase domain-containing protein [Amycolatopsis acidicola]|uniref:glycoside hydrolase domain-containing protein n=1 Tax=Amycolatopsis acidicola TaxID=2596893 RepID=UPI00140AFA04|nr:glycoside hydrolase domain-containing protein [Amycolatopsis acidicola]